MRSSISRPRAKLRLWAVAVWLLLWQLATLLAGHDFLLASPLDTLLRFFELIQTLAFWRAALHSLGRILCGFSLGTLSGTLLAGLAARFRAVEELLAPLQSVLRAIPVASFVVAALIWMPARRLSVLISFLIVFPLIYSATLSEVRRTDPRLIEMAQLLRMRPLRKLLYIYALPALPGFSAACSTAMGLAWKSGVAAELIAIPANSIGEALYKAKIYLMSGDLFAWTLLIVLLSAACARLLSLLLCLLARRLERM